MPKTMSNDRGFSLTELLVVVGLIGVLSLVAVPSLLTYWRTSSLTAGAEQLASVMNRARQLAINQNRSVCVERTGTSVRLRPTNASPADCAGAVWTGIGTDSAGLIQIANSLQVSGAASAIFTNVGGASTTATYTLTDPKTGQSRSVVVSSTGRVIIQ
jgi:prepilin-type N-terminal cleavage/methylation domain-containing protein